MGYQELVFQAAYQEGGICGAGVLSQSQVLLAFGVVAELFNGVRDAEPLDGELDDLLN